jgi:hypothetical protein
MKTKWRQAEGKQNTMNTPKNKGKNSERREGRA